MGTGTSAAELVLLNADIWRPDGSASPDTALAVSDGTISAVGDEADIRPLAGPHTTVVDLGGRTLMPGINDSHVHGCAFGLTRPPFMIDVGYPAARSIADVARLVGEAAGRAEPGEWVIGKGWDAGYLDECRADARRLPTRADLDAVSPRNPVCLQDFSGHQTWVNSAALALAGIDENTPAPAGGVIVRDGAGAAIGLLQEGAQALAQSKLPPVTREIREAAIRGAVRMLNEQGITSFTEPGLGPGGATMFGGGMAGEALDVYADLVRAGELTARVSVLMLPCGLTGSAEQMRRGLDELALPGGVDPRRLAVLGVKIFADGIPPNGTAWMYDAYHDGACGSLCVSGETDDERVAEVDEMIRLAHSAGFQVGVHVTGDRAIDTVVDGFVAAGRSNPRSDPRHYVIHGDFTSPQTLATMGRNGIGLNTNPGVKWTIADEMEHLFGAERAAYQWPLRTALDSGVALSSSSDAPVTEPDWRRAVSVMLLRESKASGRVSGPEQRIGLAEAIRAYTTYPARQDFAEAWKGSLDVGQVADLCVLDGPLRSVSARDLPDLPVVLTAVGGEIVHNTMP